MPSCALAEDPLRHFLVRRRGGSGATKPPPIGRLLTETLDLAARLMPAANGFIALEAPDKPSNGGARALTVVASFGGDGATRIGARISDEASTSVTHDGRTAARRTATVRLEGAASGVLFVAARRGKRLDARDIELVGLLARYVSRALSNALTVIAQHELSRRDELTGVRNVRGLHGELEDAVGRAMRERTDVSVLFIDVDHLKRVNDHLGHAGGSETLKRVGRALTRAVKTTGEVYRFGGDEFVVVGPGLDLGAARALGARLRSAVRETSPGVLRHVGVLPGVTISIGIATLRTSLRPGGNERRRAARLLVAADLALYRAKRAGRDAVSAATLRDDAPRPARARA